MKTIKKNGPTSMEREVLARLKEDSSGDEQSAEKSSKRSTELPFTAEELKAQFLAIKFKGYRSKSLPLPTIAVTSPTKRKELFTPLRILPQPDEYSSGDERSALVSNILSPDDFKNYHGSSDGSCNNLLNASSSGESSNDDDDDSSALLERLKKEQEQKKLPKPFSVNNKPTYNIQTSPPGIRRRHAAQQHYGRTKNKGD